MTNNSYITRALGWIKTNQHISKVYVRINSTIASMIIGRGFNQSVEDYLNENPEKKEYYDWWMENRGKLSELRADKVQFFVEPDGNIMAYFPDLPYAHTGAGRTCYAHIGQHSGCDPDYTKKCTPATPEQYEDLKQELIGIGYILNII